LFDLRLSGIFAVTAFVLSFVIGLLSRLSLPVLIIRPLIFAVVFFVLSAFIKMLIGRFLPELLEDSADEDGLAPGSRINILEDDGPSLTSAVPDGFTSLASAQATVGAKPDDSDDGLGDISDLSRRNIFSQPDEGNTSAMGSILGGIDQNAKELYNDNGGSDPIVPDFSKMFSPEPSSIEAPPAAGQAKAPGTVSTAGPVAAKAKAAGTTVPANFAIKTVESGFDTDEALPDLDSMAGAFMSDSSDEEEGPVESSAPSSPSRAASSKKAPEWTEKFEPKDMAMGLRTVLSKDKEG